MEGTRADVLYETAKDLGGHKQVNRRRRRRRCSYSLHDFLLLL